VEKYGRVRQATDDNIIGCIHFAYWVTRATDTHLECVILTASCNSGFTSIPHYCVIHMLPMLLNLYFRNGPSHFV